MKYVLILALMLFVTTGCAVDNTQLFEEMESLAERGSPEAQYHLGMFYNNGIGTEQNTAQAFKWFKESALAGDPLGNYKLGCYYAGQGQEVVAIDKHKALEYKLVAAQQGYALAQYDVASLYYQNGNIDEAVVWWEKSAAQGHPSSVYALFTLYSNDEPSRKNSVLAYGYLKIIEENSIQEHEEAIHEKLAELESGMTTAQIEQGKEFSENWTQQVNPMTVKALSGLKESKKLIEESQ